MNPAGMNENFKKYIEIHDNFLTPEECRDIVARYKFDPEKERFHFPSETQDIRVDTEGVFGNNGLTVSKIVEKVDEYTNKYLQKNKINLTSYASTIRFLQHKEGTPMRKHYDEEMDYLNQQENFRLCAALIYINDDYEGGENVFEDVGYSYKPKAGSLFIFPTSFIFTHKVNPAIGNNKYLIKFSYEVDKDKYLELTQDQVPA